MRKFIYLLIYRRKREGNILFHPEVPIFQQGGCLDTPSNGSVKMILHFESSHLLVTRIHSALLDS